MEKDGVYLVTRRTLPHSRFLGVTRHPIYSFLNILVAARDAITCVLCCADHEVIKEAAGSPILFLLCRSLLFSDSYSLLPSIERGACRVSLSSLSLSADSNGFFLFIVVMDCD